MARLFDEPLSEELCKALADIFPDSLHIRLLGQGGAQDPTVWDLARQHGCLVVIPGVPLGLSAGRDSRPKNPEEPHLEIHVHAQLDESGTQDLYRSTVRRPELRDPLRDGSGIEEVEDVQPRFGLHPAARQGLFEVEVDHSDAR